MTGKTPLSELTTTRFTNTVILSAILLYGLLAYLSYAFNLTFLPLIGIVAILGVGYVYSSLKDPYYILLLVALGSYLGNLVHLVEGAVPLTIFQVLLVACFLFVALNKLMRADFEVKLLGIELELLLFTALIFLSLIYSPNEVNGMFNALRFTVLLITVYLVVNIITNINQVAGILIILAIVSVVLGSLSIKETLLNPEAAVMDYLTDGGVKDRASGTQIDPNIFASHFLLPLAFVSSIFLTYKSYIIRGLSFLASILFIMGLMSTFSRSAWVAAAISLIIVAYYHRQLKIFVWLGLFAFFAVLFIPQLQFVALNIMERVIDIFAGSDDDSSMIRIMLGLAAMGMFFDSYFMGIGFRGFPEAFPNYYSTQVSIGVSEPHNITYTVLAELGIIGFILFVFIYWKIGSIAYHNIKNSISDLERSISITLFATYIAFIIFYQFYGGGLFDNNFWILVGLIFALNYNILKPAEQIKSELT
ncbi:MAG: O-antigen ligase family protein [Balneolales bacterium]